jgi:hypothetical protein
MTTTPAIQHDSRLAARALWGLYLGILTLVVACFVGLVITGKLRLRLDGHRPTGQGPLRRQDPRPGPVVKRPCESCQHRRGIRVVSVDGVLFLLCDGCADAAKGRAA